MMHSAKAFSNDSSCRGNLLICFTKGCSSPTDLPPSLNPIQLQPVIRMQSGGKEQLLAVFSYSNSTQKPYQQAGSVTQVQSVMVISAVLKGRLIALEVAKSRTGVLGNIRVLALLA